jgi:hypothetical protein
MTSWFFLAAVAIAGFAATTAMFWFSYDGAHRRRLTLFAGVGSAMVAGAPFVAVTLGTSSLPALRGMMSLGLGLFWMGLVLFLSAVILSKRWRAAASGLPMAPLALWTFVLLAVFTGAT